MPDSKHKRFLSDEAAHYLARLGDNIRIARKRRRWTQKQLAERSGVGEATLRRLENGDSSVSLALLANVLASMDVEDSLLAVASPDTDELGKLLERRNLPKRVRSRFAEPELDTNF